MYPRIREKTSAVYAEQIVYDELNKLSNDFIIFHSVSWVKKNLNRNFTWYENDFLILNHKYGILVLEVKGGLISCKNGLIHQENTVTHQVVVLDEGDDPLSQAKRGKYYFRDLLDRKIGHGIKSKLLIEPLIWFPSSEIIDSNLLPINYQAISFAVLDANSFTESSGFSLETRLINIYKQYNANKLTNISKDEFEKIQNVLAPDFQLVPSPSIYKGELDHAFIKLTQEQSGLLDYIQEQNFATIQGVAGTGKTMIAIEAAKRLAAAGRQVLFLCFNKLLYEHLKYNCPHKNVCYYNINTYIKMLSGLDAATGKQRVEILQKCDIKKFFYDDIIIDEAQDFENEEIVFFKTIIELKDGHFFVFYDKNQLLTTNILPEWIEKSECKLLLTKNCRNTFEIACTAYNVIDVELNQKISMVHGKQSTIAFAEKEPLKELYKIVQFYKSLRCGYENKEITILSMRSLSESIMNNIKMLNGIPIQYENDNKLGIFCTTAKKFKGLENKVIIIIDIDEKCFSNEETKRVFYVACTRATHNLTLLVDGDNEKIVQIANAIPGAKLSGKGRITVKTKTIPFKE